MTGVDSARERSSAESGSPQASKGLIRFALISGIAAWMVHLAGASALVPAACTYNLGWTIDALTALTAVVCILGAIASVSITRRGESGNDGQSPGYRMIGFIGLMTNLFSLALVLAEGAMHLWFGACQ